MTSEPDTRPIVVGVDGSSQAQLAVRWAVEEAALRGRPIRVVTVVDRRPPPSPSEGDGARPRPVDLLREMFDAAVAHATRRLGIGRVEAVFAIGVASKVLVLQTADAALLVLGSRPPSLLTSVALSSVSGAVATHAGCPVVVVRHGSQPTAQRIVVGFDGSDASEQALAFAFEEADLRGLPLTVSHVWRPYRPADPNMWSSEREVEEREHRRAWVRQSIKPHTDRYPDVPVHVAVLDGRAVAALARQSKAAELLVVGSHGHGHLSRLLLGSVSQGVLHHAHCSVAVARLGS